MHFRQHGTITIHLVVFAALAIATSFFWFALYAAEQDIIQAKHRNDRQTKAIEEHQNTLRIKLQAIESLAGFYHNSENRSNFQDIKQAQMDIARLVDLLKKLSSKENEPGTRQYYDLATLIISDSEITEGRLAEIAEGKIGYADFSINVEKVLLAFFDRIEQLQEELQVLVNTQKGLKEYIQLQSTQKKQILDELKITLEDIEKAHETKHTQAEEQLARIQEIQQKEESERATASQEIEKVQAEMKTEKTDFENKLNQKKGKIRELQAAKYGRTVYAESIKQRDFLPQEEKEDGIIVFADPKTQTVYINLGEKHAIRGLKFDVYRQAPQATRSFVGKIEIQKVMEKVSMAAVTKLQNPLDPIVNGDFIINPIFNAEESVYIAFAGKFSKISNEEAQRWAEQLGAKVEPNVSVKTNFVIVAPKSEEHENYRLALNFGIPLMSEEVFLRYIGD